MLYRVEGAGFVPVKRFASGVFFRKATMAVLSSFSPSYFFGDWGVSQIPNLMLNILIKKLASSKQTKTTKKIGNSTGGSEDAPKFKE